MTQRGSPKLAAIRRDKREAERIISTLFPRDTDRKLALRILADSIGSAASEAPGSWGTSLFQHRVCLNVGRGAVLQLYAGGILFIVTGRLFNALPAATRRVFKINGKYKFIADALEGRLSAANLTHYESFKAAHTDLIKRAAANRKTCLWPYSHSSGVVELLHGLGFTVPKPVGIHDICVYAIRHGGALDEDWRSDGAFSFVEHRSWSRAAKELALARQNGAVLPIVFADARATRDLIFRAQIDEIRLSSDGGNPQTTILASNLEKFAQPPRKTQLVLASTGSRIPGSYIRSYAICRTPKWLYSEEVLRPEVPPEILNLPDPATEGRRKLVSHLIRERNRGLVERKKRLVLEAAGRLACEVCGFDFRERYSTLGDGFCEVHHRLPLSEAESQVQTRLEDLAIVCANCHRMIHRGGVIRELAVVRAALTPNKPIETDAKSGRGSSA
jgi:hypothetical protein